MKPVEILIGADVVPTDSNISFFESGRIEQILDVDLQKKWNAADFRVFNLEAPIYDGLSPIVKWGPALRIKTTAMPGIKALNPDLILLANNHILDHGSKGLESTTRALVACKINHVGVGTCIDAIKKYHEIEINNIKIAFYNCAEHEFSIATSNTAGANPFDALDSFDDVSALKARNDYVVVCFHGGKEFYQYPSPMLQKIFRKFADKGADIVIAQHTHCVGCEEKYKQSILVYGQGNFIFENSELLSKDSLLCKLVFTKEKEFVEYIPIQLDNGKCSLSQKSKEVLDDFNRRSFEIQKKGFVENTYRLFAQKNIIQYLKQMKGNSLLWRMISKFCPIFFLRVFCKLSNLLCIRNYIETEAHRELFLTGIKNEINCR